MRTFRFPLRAAALALALNAVIGSAQAQVTVRDAWVRATVPVQKASGAFMTLRATRATRLVEVTSPVAASVQVHRSDMQDGTMRMEEVDGIDLPAGQDVSLATGGYHVMLMGLTRQLKEGETVPLTLVFQSPGKKAKAQAPERITVQAQVKPLGYTAPQGRH
ncbi:MAG: copper chaperone PCu(A)C [Gammaproteobacteria bacterium]